MGSGDDKTVALEFDITDSKGGGGYLQYTTFPPQRATNHGIVG